MRFMRSKPCASILVALPFFLPLVIGQSLTQLHSPVPRTVLFCSCHSSICLNVEEYLQLSLCTSRECCMDSPIATRLFRELFRTPARGCLQIRSRRPVPYLQTQVTSRRNYALHNREDDGRGRSNWQQRLDHFPRDVSKELESYPRVTARDLKNRKQRPKRVKMYTRDFVEGQSIRRRVVAHL